MKMPRRKVSLDFESRSRCDLKKCGSYKYWEDPSTDVLVVAVQETGSPARGPVLSWDVRKQPNEAIELLRQAIVDGWEIHAFNSQFEWGGLKYVCPRQFGLPVPDISNIRCTAAVCRSAGLPPGLGRVAARLALPMQKESTGKALIRLFSVPQKKTGRFIEWGDDVLLTVGGQKMPAAEAFQKFVDYCEQDVRTEVAVAEAMRDFALRGYALDSFLLTARLNERGVPVDVEALTNAHRLYRQHEKRLSGRFREITGFGPAQNARVLEWCQAQGYPGSSLNKASRAQLGTDAGLTPECRKALDIKGRLSFAAIKKIPAMLDWVMSDGRIRGSFKWCGAQKTWRWTSEGPQWQNMKKPPKRLRPHIEDALQDVKRGTDLLTFDINYGDPYETIASMARYFVRFPDRNILDLDFTSVEAMILPALIDCDRLLSAFRRGEDPYLNISGRLGAALGERYSLPFEIDRDTAKTVWLATQFQGGWHAVFTATGQTWKREWCETAAAVIRKENPEFSRGWRAFHDAFVNAMGSPGVWFDATRHVAFGYTEKPPFPRMLMRLPSGRPIVMPHPERNPITMVRVEERGADGAEPKRRWERLAGHLEDEDLMRDKLSLDWPTPSFHKQIVKWFHTWELSYWGHLEGVNYGTVHTYGGSLLQSCLAEGTEVLTNRGFVPIEAVSVADLLWDGSSFVAHGGVIFKGVKPCATVAGVSATEDHVFMVDGQPISVYSLSRAETSSSCARLARSAIRELSRDQVAATGTTDELGGDLRLRKEEVRVCGGSDEVLEAREVAGVWPEVSSQRSRTAEVPRPVQAPGLPRPRLHDGAVLPAGNRELSALRGEGDLCVQALAQLHRLLQRPDRFLPTGTDLGPTGCKRELRTGEYGVVDSEAQQPEQKKHPVHRHADREDDSNGRLGTFRGELHDITLPDRERSDRGRTGGSGLSLKPVYDIINCGPDHVFAVKTDHGLVLAHNCTQATGVDLLALGALNAERVGFEPFFLVHDQCLTPDDGRRNEFERAMCFVPDWFKGFPLSASADSVRSYCKT